MFKSIVKIFSISVLSVFMLTLTVSAQTSTTDVLTTEVSGVSSTATTTVVDNTLVGIEIEDVSKMPTRWSMWWRSVKEQVSLITTFNPAKKAEKQLIYAEERMRMAEYIVDNTTDEKKREWAEKLIEKSDKFIAKAEKTKDKWLNHPDTAKRNLVKNMATFQIRKDNYLDRIEEKIPEKRMEQFTKLREASSNTGKRVMAALENKNVPDDVKTHLQAVKTRVESKLQEIRVFQAKRIELQIKAKSGDDTAKEALEKFNEKRKEDVKKSVEKIKEIKSDLREKAEDGSLKAKATLKTMNKVQNAQKIEVKSVVPTKPTVKPLPPVVKPLPEATITKPALKGKIEEVKDSLEEKNEEVGKTASSS